MLALTCSFQNATHILIWHLVTLILGGLGGAVVGLIQRSLFGNAKQLSITT